MIRYLLKKIKSNSGLTIIEVVVVMAISAIAFTGMVYTYTEGVRYTRQNSSKMVLYNEGSAVLRDISRSIRLCGRARIRSFGGTRDSRLDLANVPDHGGGGIDYWFDNLGGTLKYNDTRDGISILNMTFLPMLDFNVRPGEEPYLTVRNLKFTDLDYIGAPAPFTRGFSLIRIELVLEDALGDTLYLSTVSSKRNRL